MANPSPGHWESSGQRTMAGYTSPGGSQRVGHDCSDLANTGDLKVESTKEHMPNSTEWVQVLVSHLISIYCRLYHSLTFNTKLYASVSYGY